MTTKETSQEAKQGEIETIVADFNSKVQAAEQETRSAIQSSALDDDEKTALQQKLFAAKTQTIAVPAIASLGKGKIATRGIVRSIFGDSLVGHEIIPEMFNQRGKRVFCKGDDKTLTNYTIGFLEESMATGSMIGIYQPTSMLGSAMNFDDMAFAIKGMSPKSGGAIWYNEQIDVKGGKVKSSAWFADSNYHEFRKNALIVPDVIRIATRAEVPGTANKSFMDQVLIVCGWIEKSFPQSMTEPMKKSVGAVRDDFESLRKLQNSDSTKFLKEIMKYDFIKNFMETPLETMWRIIVYEQATGIKLLQNMYLRSNVAEPVYARLGYAGCWDSNGPDVGRLDAGSSDSGLGLGCSCIGI